MKDFFPEEADKCIKIFNETKNLGEIHFFDKEGKETGYKYFKKIDGKEVYTDPPEKEERDRFFIPLSPEWETHEELAILDLKEKRTEKNIPRLKIIPVTKKEALTISAKKDIKKELENLDNKQEFFDHLKDKKEITTTLEGIQTIQVEPEQVASFLQRQEMPSSLYKSVDPTTEFGIARFIADQVNHLPRLLENATVTACGSPSNYKIYADKKLSRGQKLSFNYGFIARTDKEAMEIAGKIKKKLTGTVLKIWLACWEIGNERKKLSFSVLLTEIMKRCHPERKSYFSEKEKEEFYEEIKRLKIPEFVLEQTIKPKNRTKPRVFKYNVPMLFISTEIGLPGKTPQAIQVNLFNIQTTAPTKKTAYMGAPIKKTTLTLEARDTALATWLQIRIAQLKGGKEEKTSHDFHREDLIRNANLTTTNSSNRWKANTLLLKKLQRCKETKIIKKHPEKIEEITTLHF